MRRPSPPGRSKFSKPGVSARGDGFDWSPWLPRLTPGDLLAVRAAAAHLAAVTPGELYSVGFCFGGGQSWRLATTDLPPAGAIGFYGRPAHQADVVDRVHAPLLMLIAGDDEASPRQEFTDLDAALAGIPHTMHVYEGAPHSFFDRAAGRWREAGEDAWRRILDFTGVTPAPGTVHTLT